MKYSIDTSAILDGWRRYYPPDVFPPLWTNLEDLIEEQKLGATIEVQGELEKKDDEVAAWAKQQEGLFVPIDEDIQVELAYILGQFSRLVNTQRGRSIADPWVIALARVRGCAVVTGEVASNSTQRPKIPDVCKVLGVPCFNLLELFRREGWVFR